MNNKDAVDFIKYRTDSTDIAEKEKKSLLIAIGAVQKQIPQDVVISKIKEDVKIGNHTLKKGTKIYNCKCKYVVGYKDSYCRNCGQKLNWE